MALPPSDGSPDAAAAQRLAARVYELQVATQGALGAAHATLTAGAWTGGAAPALVAELERRAGEVRGALSAAVAGADGYARQTRVAEQAAAAAAAQAAATAAQAAAAGS